MFLMANYNYLMEMDTTEIKEEEAQVLLERMEEEIDTLKV